MVFKTKIKNDEIISEVDTYRKKEVKYLTKINNDTCNKVREIVSKHKLLEKELSSNN